VAGGYLFYAPGGEPPARAIAPAAAADELARLSSTVDRHLGSPASGGDSPERALEDALAFFVSVYDPLFGVIQPALRRCRDMLSTFLRDNDAAALDAIPTLLGGVESIAAERGRRAARLRRARSGGERAAALGDYLSRFGDESPVWDVAQPTYREDPAPLFAWLAPEDDAAPAASPPPAGDPAWSRAAREVEGRLPQPARARFAALLALARTAVALGEEDDFVYSRVQAAVRAALLGVGRRLVASGLLPEAADIFWLPLDTVRAPAGAGAPSSSALAAALAAARDQHRRALASPPPGAEARARGGAAVRGKAASGGRAIGRAWVHTNARADGAAPRAGDAMGPGAAAIVVAATLLPAELPLLRAAGLVVETGGILGHVAAQARERGIPAVVGATGACAAIATGDLLLVDGDAVADGSTDGLYRDTVPR
jgi:pyruvate,water dikinase